MYHPVVKFRNINQDVLQTVQDAECEECESPLESDSDVEDDAMTHHGDDSEIEDNPLPGPSTPRKVPFEVDCDVDIKSPWLLDLLSDMPMVTEATATPPPPAKDTSSIDLDTLFANW